MRYFVNYSKESESLLEHVHGLTREQLDAFQIRVNKREKGWRKDEYSPFFPDCYVTPSRKVDVELFIENGYLNSVIFSSDNKCILKKEIERAGLFYNEEWVSEDTLIVV